MRHWAGKGPGRAVGGSDRGSNEPWQHFFPLGAAVRTELENGC